MITRVVLTALGLWASGMAFAADGPRDGGRGDGHRAGRVQRDDTEVAGRSLSVLVGSDTSFNGNPATLRLGVVGDGRLIGGSAISLDGVLPVTFMTSGTDGLGVSGQNFALEVPPSLRLRVLSFLPIRPYADLGVGLAVASPSNEGWLFEGHDNALGWMTRAAVGVEIGKPEGQVQVVLEPSLQSYHFGGNYLRLAGMFGIGTHF